MRKIQYLAVFWTLILAIPFTALAISGAAFVTDHLSDIATSIANLTNSTASGGGWALEFAARWPEVAGMIIGQIVIFAIFYLIRREKTTDEINYPTK
jgi:hypothetical protein